LIASSQLSVPTRSYERGIYLQAGSNTEKTGLITHYVILVIIGHIIDVSLAQIAVVTVPMTVAKVERMHCRHDDVWMADCDRNATMLIDPLSLDSQRPRRLYIHQHDTGNSVAPS
jgi:hypothetical protein